jgi:putative lipoic acid-binding regulatory protein
LILGNSGKRPNISYPCEWDYRVIGNDVEKMLSAIEIAANGLEYEVKPSNVSKNGKYFSINMKLTVSSEEERDLIFQNLDSHENVIMVI